MRGVPCEEWLKWAVSTSSTWLDIFHLSSVLDLESKPMTDVSAWQCFHACLLRKVYVDEERMGCTGIPPPMQDARRATGKAKMMKRLAQVLEPGMDCTYY